MTSETLTRHTASTDELHAIAMLVSNARPDWNAAVVMSVLQAHAAGVDAADLAVAAIRAGQNLDNRTPKVIGWRGPHWDGARTRPADQLVWHWCLTCGKREDKCGQRPGVDDDHAFEPSSTPRRAERAR